jgi:hypothetical protein
VTPLYLIYHIIISLVQYTCAGLLFQVSGEAILALCGFEGFELSDQSSNNAAILGAVGGAIFAIPFAALFTLSLRHLVSSSVIPEHEEDPRQPLLSPFAATEATLSPLHEAGQSQPRTTEGSSSHNALLSLPYSNQQAESAAYKVIVQFGLVPATLALLSPFFGAVSGTFGGITLSYSKIPSIGIVNAAKAGAVGGLVPLLLIAFLLFVPKPDLDPPRSPRRGRSRSFTADGSHSWQPNQPALTLLRNSTQTQHYGATQPPNRARTSRQTRVVNNTYPHR